VRRLLRCRTSQRRNKTPQREDCGPNPHKKSVVRFGMGEQDGPVSPSKRN
jgi:hypothetical protein